MAASTNWLFGGKAGLGLAVFDTRVVLRDIVLAI